MFKVGDVVKTTCYIPYVKKIENTPIDRHGIINIGDVGVIVGFEPDWGFDYIVVQFYNGEKHWIGIPEYLELVKQNV